MRQPLAKIESRAIAKEASVKLTFWNPRTSGFVIEGTQTALATFRSLVAETMGGIAYMVTDNGSYPTYGSRIYRPL